MSIRVELIEINGYKKNEDYSRWHIVEGGHGRL